MRGTLALFASTRRETALACLFMLCVPGFQLLSLVPDMTHWGLCPSALAGGDLLLDLLRGHVRGFTFVWLVPYVVVLASLCMGPLATGRLREDVLVMAFGSRWAFWTARCLAVTVTAAVEWVALLVGGVLGVLVVGGHPSLEACVAGYSLWGDAGQTLAYDSGVVLTFLVLVLMSSSPSPCSMRCALPSSTPPWPSSRPLPCLPCPLWHLSCPCPARGPWHHDALCLRPKAPRVSRASWRSLW